MLHAVIKRTLRPLLLDAAVLAGLCGALLLPSASRAATISQTISFESIAPFGTYTDGTFTTGGWNVAFPIGNLGGVQAFKFSFASTDPDYLDQQGPLGGVPWVEFGWRDDASVYHAFASLGMASPDGTVHGGTPAELAMLKTLLADGELIVSLGGYESFPDHSDDFFFGPTSTLTLSFEMPDGGGSSTVPGGTVPEPASYALALVAMAAAAAASRRGRGRG